jgi:hypothetical protein
MVVAYAEHSGGDDVRDFSLVHAACVAMIERSALVTTAFTVRGKHILHPRPEYQDIVDTEDGVPPSVGQLVLAGKQSTGVDETDYWRNWRITLDYLYVLLTDDNAPNPDPQHLTLMYEGDQFQLLRPNLEFAHEVAIPAAACILGNVAGLEPTARCFQRNGPRSPQGRLSSSLVRHR